MSRSAKPPKGSRLLLVSADNILAGGAAQAPAATRPANLAPMPGGLAGRSESASAYALKSGATPEGDVLGDSMGEAIDNSTGRRRDEDPAAIAIYIKGLPTIGAP